METPAVKIRKISRFFRWLFTAIFIALPVIHGLLWFFAPIPKFDFMHLGFVMDLIPKGVQVMTALSPLTRLYAFLVDLIPLIILEFLFYSLIRLFKLYEQGDIFSTRNVVCIKNIGASLLIFQIIQVICNGLLSMVLTWNNPPGFRVITVTLSGLNVSMMLMALLIILISWVMMEGCRLRNEQQLTI